MAKDPKTKELNKGHIVTKTIWHCFLIVFELGVVAFAFYRFSNCLVPCSDWIEIVERLLMGTAIYEVLVILILTSINDTRRDALLALRTAYEMAELYCETKDIRIKEHLEKQIEHQLDTGMLNPIAIREKYQALTILLETDDAVAIRIQTILVNHSFEAADLRWRFSLLVQLFK